MALTLIIYCHINKALLFWSTSQRGALKRLEIRGPRTALGCILPQGCPTLGQSTADAGCLPASLGEYREPALDQLRDAAWCVPLPVGTEGRCRGRENNALNRAFVWKRFILSTANFRLLC